MDSQTIIQIIVTLIAVFIPSMVFKSVIEKAVKKNKIKLPMEEKDTTKVDWFAIAKRLFEVGKNQNKFVAILILVMVLGASAIALFQLLKLNEKPQPKTTKQPDAENVEFSDIKHKEDNR